MVVDHRVGGGPDQLVSLPARGDAGGRGGRGGGEGRALRQLTTTPGQKSHAQFSPDSREVYYLEAGRVQALLVDSRVSRAVSVTAEMDINFDREKMAAFEQAWAGQRDSFYDPKMHGVDWAAVRKRYAPLIEAARTSDEVRRILRLMIGELNASHSGVSRSGGGGRRPRVHRTARPHVRSQRVRAGRQIENY